MEDGELAREHLGLQRERDWLEVRCLLLLGHKRLEVRQLLLLGHKRLELR